MFTGRVPFKGEHDFQTFKLILSRTLQFPSEMDSDTKNLIDGLLALDPKERLGSDIQQLKNHKFFKGIDFNNLYKKKPPIS